ncbi:hypothetical protein KSS87_008445 [Heliosperma pusillum]|nr:hypothetical protein KSS87_008445 [Heliosperma pusillum]
MGDMGAARQALRRGVEADVWCMRVCGGGGGVEAATWSSCGSILKRNSHASFRCFCANVANVPLSETPSSPPLKYRAFFYPTLPIAGHQSPDTYETLFFIVDLHAITLPYEPQQLAKSTRDTAAIYLACGVDASKASIFVQSHVRAHVELMWLLSSTTPIGWLNRMIQFKEKSRKSGDENVGVALLTYPVLMAADILLYQVHFIFSTIRLVYPDDISMCSDVVSVFRDFNSLATKHGQGYGNIWCLDGLSRALSLNMENGPVNLPLQSDFVPVGDDQKQHLELTRQLAERVNNLYGGRKWKKMGGRGGSIFKIPEALIPPAGARVMSLTDGLSKMSKSAPSDLSRINLLDPKDVINNKIKRCKTDSFVGLEFDNPERPECNNLLSVYQLVSGKRKEEVAQECQDMSWGTFKPLLTDAVIEHLQPIQMRYKEIMSDPAYLDEILANGAARATEIADATVNNVYQAMGFLRQ